MVRDSRAGASGLGQSLVRLGVGGYWLFFASQKWPAPYGVPPHGINWLHPLMEASAKTNPIPGVQTIFSQLVVPNWQIFAVGQTVVETVVGVLLILGLATRPAALVGTLVAIELSLTVAFLDQDLGLRWLYYLAIPATLAVLVGGAGSVALGRILGHPRWLAA